jgi:hypothetical protein
VTLSGNTKTNLTKEDDRTSNKFLCFGIGKVDGICVNKFILTYFSHAKVS